MSTKDQVSREIRRVVREMTQDGTTDREIAERVGVHPVTLSNWQRGEKGSGPGWDGLDDFAQKLGFRVKVSLISNKEAPPAEADGVMPGWAIQLVTEVRESVAALHAETMEAAVRQAVRAAAAELRRRPRGARTRGTSAGKPSKPAARLARPKQGDE